MSPPLRVISVPDSVEHVVVGVFGLQYDRPESSEVASPSTVFKATRLFEYLLQTEVSNSAPILVEHAVDQETSEPIFMAYWSSDDAYNSWLHSAEVKEFWKTLHDSWMYSGLGAYREVWIVHRSRFHHGGSTNYLSLRKQFSEVPSSISGWGSFRRRLPTEETEKFNTPLSNFPTKHSLDTRGRSLGISVPDNLFFLRETQVRDPCTPADIQRWEANVGPALNAWLDELDAEPARTGCLSLRRLHENEKPNGSVNPNNMPPSSSSNRTTQLAYFLSLEHAQRAARREPTHKAMRIAYRDILQGDGRDGTGPGSVAVPPVELWAGVYILESAKFDNIYVNCRAETGLLRWFEPVDVCPGNLPPGSA